MVVTSEALNI